MTNEFGYVWFTFLNLFWKYRRQRCFFTFNKSGFKRIKCKSISHSKKWQKKECKIQEILCLESHIYFLMSLFVSINFLSLIISIYALIRIFTFKRFEALPSQKELLERDKERLNSFSFIFIIISYFGIYRQADVIDV